ncbi:MAG: hypothetical protein ACPLYF_01670 [Fervidobacterium sp.]
MVEVNEEIVKQYFELQGYFVLTNVSFWKAPGKRGIKGRGDIDLVMFHPIKKEAVIAEVKGWHEEKMTGAYFKDKETYNRLFSFVSNEAMREAHAKLGTRRIKKVLIVPDYNEDFKQKALTKVDEILNFRDVLGGIIKEVKKKPKEPYKSEVLQMIRLLSKYGFLK